jgi:hypothetical protein
VIEEPAAIEDDALDAFFDRPLGDRLADGSRPDAAARVLRSDASFGSVDAADSASGRWSSITCA